MTGAEALRLAIQDLRHAGVEEAVPDARRLLAFAMAIPADRLTLHVSDLLDTAAQTRFADAVAARVRRQPVSQITGKRLFWGQEFEVTPDVLDPRPETECLVAAARERPFAKMLDLGTGTGCILLSCLKESPNAHGVGADVSPAALAVAGRNADRLGLASRCRLIQSDWCKSVEGRFDLIVSNPPYIAADEMPSLSPEVRDWEPHLALTPGGDGLAAYRALAAQAPARLLPGGRILVEIGPTQAAEVVRMFDLQGLTGLKVRPDLDGRDRIVEAVKPA